VMTTVAWCRSRSRMLTAPMSGRLIPMPRWGFCWCGPASRINTEDQWAPDFEVAA
jgi:hypothetical protein